MQDQNQKPTDTSNINPPAANPVGATSKSNPVGGASTTAPKTPAPAKPAPAKPAGASDKAKVADPKPAPGVIPANDFMRRIIDKIRNSENILVALSRDPSVDEIAAAIGLTMFLDGLQKHTTAIYSGMTPDALQFLQPGETFESNTDSLQDFIIALSKDKADHLRYKLDGDFVKVYITPYKTVLTENDLEFSHGDYNVDLVLALGVPQATDLDAALSEYGRIMHDATTVDITCDAPGRFGEIEWSDPGASSVCEMITKLIFAMQPKGETVDKEIATALLTGIVAATGRFSNDRTNSETMQLASKLMSMGADQQLIASHVMDNDAMALGGSMSMGAPIDPVMPTADAQNLLVGRDYASYAPTLNETVVPADVPAAGGVEYSTVANQAQAAANMTAAAVAPTEAAVAVNEAVDAAAANVAAVNQAAETAAPATTVPAAPAVEAPKDYAAMLVEALAEPLPTPTAASRAGLIEANPVAQAQTQPQKTVDNITAPAPAGAEPVANPNENVVLPPPPAPTAGANMMPPVLPEVQVPPEMAAQQAAEQAQAMAAQASQAEQTARQANPGAFQIPGAAA